jgi:hypothetical protein
MLSFIQINHKTSSVIKNKLIRTANEPFKPSTISNFRVFIHCYRLGAVEEWRTRWSSWLRYCATSRKDVGSITDSVIGNFVLHNSSGCTTALVSIEVSNRYISWRVKVAGA